MRQGRPIVVHGDGTSLWTLTHHQDFAHGFVPLLGHPRTIGDAFHITSDDVLTWNQIARALAAAVGAPADIVHVPSDAIAAPTRVGAEPARRQGPLDGLRQLQAAPVVPGYRATSRSSGAPARRGLARRRPARQQVDTRLDAIMDKLVQDYGG